MSNGRRARATLGPGLAVERETELAIGAAIIDQPTVVEPRGIVQVVRHGSAAVEQVDDGDSVRSEVIGDQRPVALLR